MTPNPSETGPAGEEPHPPAGAPTQPLQTNAAPTQPLPPHASAAGSHRIPETGEPDTGTDQQPGGFFAWIRSLGLVRGTDRWIGGVSSSIAARTGLDPVLVRGLFVVLALFGVGVLLYGLAWAFLPEPDGRIHAEEALRGSWSSGTTGALVACILGAGSPSIFWADDGFFGGLFWSLFWVAGIGLLIYWLATRSGGRESTGPVRDPAQTGYSHPAPAAGYPQATFGTSRPGQFPAPSATPPAGAFDWTAPERTQPPVPVPRRSGPRGAEVALALGAVLLTIGTVLTLDYLSLIAVESPVAVALAAAAVVNGLAIVVLGALGRSSGILGLTAAALLVSAAATGSTIGSYANVVVANQADWVPDNSHPATGGYALAAVDGELDLRYFSDGDWSSAEVPVSVAASDLTILVPNDIPVLVRTDMLAGNVVIDNGDSVTSSGSIWRSSDHRLNGAGDDPLVVHVKGVASNVLVTVNESDLER